MPEISIAWFSWITIPIGFVMLGIILWQVKRAKQPKQVAKIKEAEMIPSRREALESAKVAWGLWHTGTRMRIDFLLEVESLRRVLLLEPNAQNPSLGYISTKSKNPVDWIIGEIRATTKVALDNDIDVRWYFTARESALTIYDPTPVGDKPCSENAWIYVEYFAPSVGVDQRKGHIIHNSGKDKNRFMGYYKEYEDIWNDSNKSTQAKQTLEDEHIPKLAVKPSSGRRQWDWEHEHLMWAELQVTNTSPSMTLKDVEVRVVSCIYVQPKQDKPNSYVLVNLHDWNPTSIYWSVRDASPSQLSLSISPDATKTALVAFQDNSNGVQSVFNAPTHPIIVDGAKIEVEISSPNSALWKGSFYIECTPNWFRGPQATFEFVKWEDWEANHDIVPLTPNKEDSQTE